MKKWWQNLTLGPVQLKRSVVAAGLFFLLLVGGAHAADRSEGSPGPLKRNSLSFLGGSYTMQTGTANLSGIGSMAVVYAYSFSRRFSAMVGYSSVNKTSSGFGSVVSGFDFGVQYCLFSCTVETRSLSDVAKVVEFGRFGIELGLGMAQQSFQATTATIGFSGLLERIELNYFLAENFKLLGAFQNASLSNVKNSLDLQTYMVGVGFAFGFSDLTDALR